ncbi:MAG: hypothetical protein IT308_09525 [Anaerolineaceae bacterium]|nr:hypothetical protein [Anaerolineaceae bacterium]
MKEKILLTIGCLVARTTVPPELRATLMYEPPGCMPSKTAAGLALTPPPGSVRALNFLPATPGSRKVARAVRA